MPETTLQPRVRNQSMECFKIVASILVVFLHVPFPGKLGSFIMSVAGNFAVPVFFAITGYFNYGADRTTLTRRLKHLLRLYLLAIVVNIVYGVITTELSGGSSVAWLRSFWPEPEEWMLWITLHQDPRNGQLWYLTASCVCYLILRMYVTFFQGKTVDYRPLYLVSVVLSVLYLILMSFPYAVGIEFSYRMLTNGYFVGLPMFTLGIFFHQYQEIIRKNFRLNAWKLLLLIVLGQLYLWAQGLNCLPFGIYLKTIGLSLLLIYYPTVSRKSGSFEKIIEKFGAWSTYIYIFHILVFCWYTDYLQMPVTRMLSGGAAAEENVRPLIVAGISFLTAILFERGEWLCKKLIKRWS